VYDVSGAGDTCIAALEAALAVSLSPVDGTQLASVAAKIAVGKLIFVGVSPYSLTRERVRCNIVD
jgi:bifunctional ADP-heptose synthase (sugar kinase/adenylyltransferase)